MLFKNTLNVNIWKGTPCFWQGGLNIEKPSILLKLVHKFNVISIKRAIGSETTYAKSEQ